MFICFHSYTGATATIVAFYLIRISTVPRVSSGVTVQYTLCSIDLLTYDMHKRILCHLDQAIANGSGFSKDLSKIRKRAG